MNAPIGSTNVFWETGFRAIRKGDFLKIAVCKDIGFFRFVDNFACAVLRIEHNESDEKCVADNGSMNAFNG
jgi:hypothetical protein